MRQESEIPNFKWAKSSDSQIQIDAQVSLRVIGFTPVTDSGNLPVVILLTLKRIGEPIAKRWQKLQLTISGRSFSSRNPFSRRIFLFEWSAGRWCKTGTGPFCPWFHLRSGQW